MRSGIVYYLILLPAVYLGIVTSYQDWREGKIYNKHVLTGLIVGLGWLALVATFHFVYLEGWDLVARVGPKILFTVALTLLVSFVLWWMNIWAAADAKMFTVYVVLLPLVLYYDDRLGYIVALTMMVNAYVVAFVFISLDFLHRLVRVVGGIVGRKIKGDSLGVDWSGVRARFWKNLGITVKVFFGFVFLLIAIRLMRRGLQSELETFVPLDKTTLFLLLFLAFRPLHALLENVWIFVLVLLGVGGYLGWVWFQDPTGHTVWDMVNMGALSISVIAFRQIYTYWSSLVEVRRIPIDDFEPRMYVSPKTLEYLRDESVFGEDEIKEFSIDGATDEQWRRIQEAYRKEGAPETIEVENTMPFAPFLFLGMIVTAIHGDVIVRMSGN